MDSSFHTQVMLVARMKNKTQAKWNNGPSKKTREISARNDGKMMAWNVENPSMFYVEARFTHADTGVIFPVIYGYPPTYPPLARPPAPSPPRDESANPTDQSIPPVIPPSQFDIEHRALNDDPSCRPWSPVEHFDLLTPSCFSRRKNSNMNHRRRDSNPLAVHPSQAGHVPVRTRGRDGLYLRYFTAIAYVH